MVRHFQSWPVQGIWPECSDGTDVNASTVGNTKKYVATGSDDGLVSLYLYPCLAKKAKKVEGKGHSSHVTNVRFCNDDTRIVSVGGNDRCAFVWMINEK